MSIGCDILLATAEAGNKTLPTMPSVPVLNSHTLGSVYLSKTAGGISSTLGQERGVVVQRVQVLTGETENTSAAPHGGGAFFPSSHGDGGLEALLATCV